MTVTVDNLFEEAMSLSDDSRVALAERLIESVDPDESVFKAQIQVAQQRADALDAGTVEAIPGDIALARVRESILRRDQP
jgi:putative addiction module component (TIGR02574 family)